MNDVKHTALEAEHDRQVHQAWDRGYRAGRASVAPDMHATGTELLDLLDNWMVVTSMTANERYAAAVEAFRAALASGETP